MTGAAKRNGEMEKVSALIDVLRLIAKMQHREIKGESES